MAFLSGVQEYTPLSLLSLIPHYEEFFMRRPRFAMQHFVRSNLTNWEEPIVCFICLFKYYFEKTSEYDQEIPQSHLADQPMALRG